MMFGWLFILAIVLIATVAAHLSQTSGRFAKPLNADDFVVEKKAQRRVANSGSQLDT
jgi:hypothetical protein